MKWPAFAFAASLGILQAATAATPADYAYLFPIDTQAAAASSAWRIELTPAVYAWAQDAGLRDIEIFNAANQPVAFARNAADTKPSAQEHRAALPALALPAAASAPATGDLRLIIDRDAAGRLRRIDAGEQAAAASRARDWLLDASAVDRPIDDILLDWSAPASGVVARFSIEASDDLQNWHGLGNATVLALEQDGAHLERHELALGGVRAKYFRLRRLDDGPDLDGLAASAHSTERGHASPARAWLRADAVAASSDTDNTPGVERFQYTLPAALPVDRARIELASDNALAALLIATRNPSSPHAQWIEQTRLTAFRLRQGDELIHNDDIELRAVGRVREFRLESRTPLAAAPLLSLGYRPDAIVFLAEGDGPYTLAVGSLRARHPDYPVEAALASLRAKLGNDWQPPQAALGSAKISAGDAALRAPPAPLPWRRWILWGVLIAGAALVGGFALSLLRNARRDDNRG